ncbi:hypothetical protein BKA56DRAFT_620932 [Ilyonectria sp. MPI-CAGE-AT-0026]|nr:hypothetical protein BKA56DRAFT_620932 [Ilyonectria sp. MPI-CAGE-AT-0026]
MALLLKERHQEVQITEDVLKAAAGNSGVDGAGEAIMTLLLQERRYEVKITEEILKAAVRNRDFRAGSGIIFVLLGIRVQEARSAEEDVKRAAGDLGEGVFWWKRYMKTIGPAEREY